MDPMSIYVIVTLIGSVAVSFTEMLLDLVRALIDASVALLPACLGVLAAIVMYYVLMSLSLWIFTAVAGLLLQLAFTVSNMLIQN